MPVTNSRIAELFENLADVLEIEGANPFRIRAYRNAARVIGGRTESVAELLRQGDDLSRLRGIGKDLALKVGEIIRTGKLGLLEESRRRIPRELTELLSLPSLGPRRVQALRKTLNVRNLKDLEALARSGKIQKLRGFGLKTEQRILRELGRRSARSRRLRLPAAEESARLLIEHLSEAKGIARIEAAGSVRRRKETVGDLDLVATGRNGGAAAMERFLGYDDVETVLAKGKTRSTIVLSSGLQVDFRVVPPESFGAALLYFTGSKAHGIALRGLAQRRGLKINEYGLFRGSRRLAGSTEREIYGKLGLAYVEPELREDRGELEAAAEGRLPELVSLQDIRGDLHAHTSESDGRQGLEEMARAAKARGYEYLAITDHTQRLTVARGLSPARFRKQMREIDRLNAKLDGLVLLKAAEVDILEDGALDLPDDVLAEMDLTICSIHSRFGLSRRKQTERILRAMDHPRFSILGHPTGRLIPGREPYEVDLERVLEGARERGCHVELNSQPERFDLSDLHCQLARRLGVKVAISTDAHSDLDFDWLRFGVSQARRGWLGARDVLNTLPLEELRKALRR